MPSRRFQTLPPPLGDPPYHYDLTTAVPGIDDRASSQGHIIFHTVGDTGGVKNPDRQRVVAAAMKTDLNQMPEKVPSFFYHLGDVVYFNGEYDQYYEQFYEPYDHYDPPIFSIPGNHDGAPLDDSHSSLDGWVKFFMTATPHVDPESTDAPRVTLSQPNCYFTLNCPYVTIVGLYTNIPEGGSVDSIQQQWLTNELHTAPMDKALIVALHHPIYSFDDHHSGSSRMADVLQQSINDSRRVPNMVLTAHVHNYQRIERKLPDGLKLPFLVVGNGGYHHLHGLNAENGDKDPDTHAKLIVGDDKRFGYVTLKVDAEHISGMQTAMKPNGDDIDRKADEFEYSAEPLQLSGSQTIDL